eukprot:11045741-Ditylum_brightwellii.AAC.1
MDCSCACAARSFDGGSFESVGILSTGYPLLYGIFTGLALLRFDSVMRASTFASWERKMVRSPFSLMVSKHIPKK